MNDLKQNEITEKIIGSVFAVPKFPGNGCKEMFWKQIPCNHQIRANLWFWQFMILWRRMWERWRWRARAGGEPNLWFGCQLSESLTMGWHGWHGWLKTKGDNWKFKDANEKPGSPPSARTTCSLMLSGGRRGFPLGETRDYPYIIIRIWNSN